MYSIHFSKRFLFKNVESEIYEIWIVSVCVEQLRDAQWRSEQRANATPANKKEPKKNMHNGHHEAVWITRKYAYCHRHRHRYKREPYIEKNDRPLLISDEYVHQIWFETWKWAKICQDKCKSQTVRKKNNRVK